MGAGTQPVHAFLEFDKSNLEHRIRKLSSCMTRACPTLAVSTVFGRCLSIGVEKSSGVYIDMCTNINRTQRRCTAEMIWNGVVKYVVEEQENLGDTVIRGRRRAVGIDRDNKKIGPHLRYETLSTGDAYR